MTKISVRNPEYFEIFDEITGEKYYGCNQEWYKKTWQRMAGCGPTVASSIIVYSKKNAGTSKGDSLKLMDKMWEHVTPTMKGVNSTNIFYDGLVSYAESSGKHLLYDVVDVPKKKEKRPPLRKVISFIKDSLDKDTPIAFLNLCNGEEKFLDKWHWVTLVSMEYEGDLSTVTAEILDEGMKKSIDLLLWYNTTTLGGGFVSFLLK